MRMRTVIARREPGVGTGNARAEIGVIADNMNVVGGRFPAHKQIVVTRVVAMLAPIVEENVSLEIEPGQLSLLCVSVDPEACVIENDVIVDALHPVGTRV